MSAKDYPSVEFVRQCLREEDGRLFWLERPREHFKTNRASSVWNSRFPGKEAGGPREMQGGWRWIIELHGIAFRRSYLVWLFHKGEWPSSQLDHRNRDSLDDKIENIRLATLSQNRANIKRNSNNSSGFKGVGWRKDMGKWIARIGVGRKQIRLGYFGTPEEAHAAYVDAARKYFGEFAFGG